MSGLNCKSQTPCWVWHDIETAPKNGEVILLMQGRNRICKTGRWDEHHEHWAIAPGPMGYLAEATHWCSLKEACEYWDKQTKSNSILDRSRPPNTGVEMSNAQQGGKAA